MRLVYMRSSKDMMVWVAKKPTDYDFRQDRDVGRDCPNCGNLVMVSAEMAYKYGEGICNKCGTKVDVSVVIPCPVDGDTFGPVVIMFSLN